MDLEGEYFIFDWDANYTEGNSGLVVMQVEDGKLVDRYDAAEQANMYMPGPEHDQWVLDQMKDSGITKVYTTFGYVEHPATFLGLTMLKRELIVDDPQLAEQWDRYQYSPVKPNSRKGTLVQKAGIEILVLEDMKPYIVAPEPKEPEMKQVPLPL